MYEQSLLHEKLLLLGVTSAKKVIFCTIVKEINKIRNQKFHKKKSKYRTKVGLRVTVIVKNIIKEIKQTKTKKNYR